MGAMIGVLWTYDGWINTASLAEEIREPSRNIPPPSSGGCSSSSPFTSG